MIRFEGYRPHPPADYEANGTAAPADQPQYEGVIFADGSVAIRWCTEYRSTSIWADFWTFYKVHGHPEYGTRIIWLDEAPVNGDLAGMTEIVATVAKDQARYVPVLDHHPSEYGTFDICSSCGHQAVRTNVRSFVGQPLAQLHSAVLGDCPGSKQPLVLVSYEPGPQEGTVTVRTVGDEDLMGGQS